MRKPLVSVLITTYNSSATIERLMNSIVQQKGVEATFRLEILVVDDCSNDDTVKLLEQYPVQVYVNKQNTGGPNVGRNQLLQLAIGEYITFADHDDEWTLDRIQTFLQYVDQASILSSGYGVIDVRHQTENSVVHQHKKGYRLFKQNETFLQLLQKNYQYQITYLGSLFFSKELKSVLFEIVNGQSDFDYQLRLFHQQKSLEISKILHYRYVDGANLSLNQTYREKDATQTIEELKNYQQQYPKKVALGIKKTYGSLARYYYLMGKMSFARKNFLRANLSLKNILYYCTTFWGSSLIKKYFNVFG